jgi:DNA-binding transcriptional ArsR family regulator
LADLSACLSHGIPVLGGAGAACFFLTFGDYLLASMNKKIRDISSQSDSEKKRADILNFLLKHDKPASLAEIAQAIQSSENETEHHLDVLREKGWIDYIPACGGWGFIVKNRRIIHKSLLHDVMG